MGGVVKHFEVVLHYPVVCLVRRGPLGKGVGIKRVGGRDIIVVQHVRNSSTIESPQMWVWPQLPFAKGPTIPPIATG